LIVYGEWPISGLDHKDGDPSNNRISNLRLATNQENIRNSRIRRDNTSGMSGVWLSRDKKQWEVKIKVGVKRLYVGIFSSFEDACKARKAAEIQYFGEFRRG
jgi:hypothetical protein